MTPSGAAGARRRMVDELRRTGIRDERVLAAMAAVPREKFLPDALRARAFSEDRLPIGEGQSMSSPWTVARLAELVAAPAGAKLLEVGTGSGYQAAVLAAMGYIVFSVERHLSLAREAGQRLRQLGYLAVTVKQFDGTYGWAAQAPYRGIVVTAAGPLVPEALLSQLGEGGRIVAPVARGTEQRLIVVEKTADGLREEDHGLASFVPLIGRFGYPAAPPGA